MLGIAHISNDTREILICEIDDIIHDTDYPDHVKSELTNLLAHLCDCDKVIIRSEIETFAPWET